MLTKYTRKYIATHGRTVLDYLKFVQRVLHCEEERLYGLRSVKCVESVCSATGSAVFNFSDIKRLPESDQNMRVAAGIGHI